MARKRSKRTLQAIAANKAKTEAAVIRSRVASGHRVKALPLTRRDLERCAAEYDIPFRAVEIAIKIGALGKGGKVTLTDFDKWRKARAV